MSREIPGTVLCIFREEEFRFIAFAQDHMQNSTRLGNINVEDGHHQLQLGGLETSLSPKMMEVQTALTRGQPSDETRMVPLMDKLGSHYEYLTNSRSLVKAALY